MRKAIRKLDDFFETIYTYTKLLYNPQLSCGKSRRVRDRAEGIQAGERKAKLEMARALRAQLTVDEMAQITGLTPAEIASLE